MDFAWTEEQLEFKNTIIEFAQKELNDGALERDSSSSFARENWRKCVQEDIQGLAVPEKYGGAGADILTAALVMEGLGNGCRDGGLTFGLDSQMWSVQPTILDFGSNIQKEKYLPGLCQGELIGSYGMTEPDYGSDAFSLRTTATKKDGGYVLNGTKTSATFATLAGFAVVFAMTDPRANQVAPFLQKMELGPSLV